MNRFKENFKVFILGFLSFTVSQVMIRIPLLKLASNNISVTEFAAFNPLIFGLILAFTAGLFEEVGRFVIKKVALKPYECRFSEPIIFGIGHSVSEIVLILSPFITGANSWNFLSSLFFIERILATFVHIGCTFIIWNGFIKNMQIRYLIYGVLAHFAVDAVIPFAHLYKLTPVTIELLLAVFAVLFIIYIVYSRKYYTRRDKK